MKLLSILVLACPLYLFAQSPWVNSKETYTQFKVGGITNYNRIFQGSQKYTAPLNGSITEWNAQTYVDMVGMIN